jgi:hypothetical protein
MGMFTALAASVLPTIATAATQFSSGQAQGRQETYNAGLYEQQAKAIDVQKVIEAGQYNRVMRRTSGSIIARTASAGLTMSGSPMAVLVDNLTQMEMDKSIGQYNFEVQKRFALSTADEYRRRGNTAVTQGYTNAFSSLLRGGFDYSMRSGWLSGSNDPTGRYNVGYGRGYYPGGYRSTAY